MIGADLIVDLLSQVGVNVCITNPGTTELPIVESLGKQHALRFVLALQEGVATGAADGAFRVSNELCCALLHLGPGLMNGASFLHDARRSRTPILVLVGQHVRSHLNYDPPLSSDIASLSASVCVYYSEIAAPENIVEELLSAIEAAMERRGPAVVSIPHDVQTASVGETQQERYRSFVMPGALSALRTSEIEQVASRIEQGDQVMFFVGGRSLEPYTLTRLGHLKRRYPLEVLIETFPSVLKRGNQSPDFDKLPYFPDAAQAILPKSGYFVLLGALNPVSFFAFGDGKSLLLPEEVEIIELVTPSELAEATMDLLLTRLGVQIPDEEPLVSTSEFANSLGGMISKHIGEGDIVVDEGRTGVPDLFMELAKAKPHTYLGHNGGAIGEGMPLGVGAALVAPGNLVWVVQADGGGMYAPQALWTMAREQLEVKVVIVSNRAYRILELEMQRAEMSITDEVSKLTSLTDPEINWCQLANSMGVPSTCCHALEDLDEALSIARATRGPYLIEMNV